MTGVPQLRASHAGRERDAEPRAPSVPDLHGRSLNGRDLCCLSDAQQWPSPVSPLRVVHSAPPHERLDVTQGRIHFEIMDDIEVDPPLGDTARKFAAARCRSSARHGLAYLLETRPNRFAIGAISSGLAANQPATTTTMATMNQIRPAQPSIFVPANIYPRFCRSPVANTRKT